MSKNTRAISEPKFTRGEKCIFTHLVITFIMILILFFIYAIHVYLVRHIQHGIFSTRRSSLDEKRLRGYENILVGYIYLNITTKNPLCNTLLLKPRWSVCTAHCVAIRTEPDMAHVLFAWRIKYKLGIKDTGQQLIFITPIKRSIAHSLFSREMFTHNIGLLEHTETYSNSIPNHSNALSVGAENGNNMFLIAWSHSNTEIKGNRDIEIVTYDVRRLSTAECLDALSPVTVIRNYEFCVTLQNRLQMSIDYGGVVFTYSKVMGFFSWGERQQKNLPMVILNITSFQAWLTPITGS